MKASESEIAVRLVAEQDVPRVITLVRDVLAEFGLRFGEGAATDEELTRLPGSYLERGGAFWVAVARHGEMVGTCGLFPLGEGTFELRKMYLTSAARGHGLGQRLLDESIAWARAHSGSRLVLDTVEQMTRAIAFYESNGFMRDDAQVRGARCTRGYARMI